MKKNRHKLFDDFSFEISDDDKAHMKYFFDNREKVFKDYPVFIPHEIMTEEEAGSLKKLRKNTENKFTLRLYILKGNKKIGWFVGEQKDDETFYMRNTGIFQKYQGLNIYKNFLPKLLVILKEKGFQKITSSHSVTNNRIIIAKLKAGFIITGFEISDMFGLMVNLTYFFNDVRRKIIKFRVGEIKPDAEVKRLLKFTETK